MSSISYCKAVTGRGQTPVNGKGHDEGQNSESSTALKHTLSNRLLLLQQNDET